MTTINAEQNKTLLFAHVPKTAGTTLRCIVGREYLGQELFVIHHDIQRDKARLKHMGEREKRRLRAVFGHMCWGWHDLLSLRQPYAYITVLREPAERVLSLYAHCRLSEHYLGEALAGRDLVYFLQSGVSCTGDNGMVRQLCGRDTFYQKPWREMKIPAGKVTRDDLEAAKANLRACAVVGVSEQFDTFIAAMRRRFGWRTQQWRNENITRWPRPRLQDLNHREREALEQATALDRELYELAVELVEGQK